MMDQLEDSLKPEVFHLGPWESYQTISVIPINLFFRNPSPANRSFMPTAEIQDSLCRTIQEIPLLAGRLHESRSRFSVVVDPHNLNLPKFEESDCRYSFKDLSESGFSPDKLPKSLAAKSMMSAPTLLGKLRPLTVAVTRLRDNSGVIVSPTFLHHLLDSYGVFSVLSRWAEIMRNMTKPASPNRARLVYDRQIVLDALRPHKAHGRLGQLEHEMLSKSVFGSLFKRLPYKLRLFLPRAHDSLPVFVAKTFYVTTSALSELVVAVRKELDPHQRDISRRVSENDVLCAFISKCLAASIVSSTRSMRLVDRLSDLLLGLFGSDVSPATTELCLGMACDLRPRLNLPREYAGTALINTMYVADMEFLARPMTPTTLAGVALKIREMVDGVTPNVASRFVKLAEEQPDYYLRYLANMAQRHPMINFSNVSRFDVSVLDFGYGAPEMVSVAPRGTYSLAVVAPRPGGLGVTIKLKGYVMRALLENGDFAGLFKVLY